MRPQNSSRIVDPRSSVRSVLVSASGSLPNVAQAFQPVLPKTGSDALPRLLRRILPLALAACLALGLTIPAAADGAVPDESMRRAHSALRELDRFLDHHPLLENDLRLDPRLVADRDYLGKNSELQSFLAGNPGVIGALQLEPRHFLHRALIREASVPLRYADVAQLDPFFAVQPAIEREIVENPARIRDRAYVNLHPELGDFLAQHPLFDRVFQPEPSDNR